MGWARCESRSMSRRIRQANPNAAGTSVIVARGGHRRSVIPPDPTSPSLCILSRRESRSRFVVTLLTRFFNGVLTSSPPARGVTNPLASSIDFIVSLRSQIHAETVLSSVEPLQIDGTIDPDVGVALQALWTDKNVRYTVSKGNEFQLNDSAP